MGLRDVRRRCQTLLDECALPTPFDASVFRRAVEDRRGRPIRMVPRRDMVGPCGVLVSLSDTDYIFYESGTSPVHRDHIVAHELGHLLCEHEPAERIGQDIISDLLPDLDPAMVRTALGRTSYGHLEEREAEMIASLALGCRRAEPVPADAVMDRLQRSLGAIRG